MSRQGEESRQETRDKICLHCPAKTHQQQRENNTTQLCRFRTPTEGRVCSTTKNCVPQNGYNGKLWQHKDVHGSVSSCSLSLCECTKNLFPRMCTTYLRIDFASHWTLYNIVFHGMRFSAHRQLMSYLTRFSINPSTTRRGDGRLKMHALPSVRVFVATIAIPFCSEAASTSRRERGVGMWVLVALSCHACCARHAAFATAVRAHGDVVQGACG